MACLLHVKTKIRCVARAFSRARSLCPQWRQFWRHWRAQRRSPKAAEASFGAVLPPRANRRGTQPGIPGNSDAPKKHQAETRSRRGDPKAWKAPRASGRQHCRWYSLYPLRYCGISAPLLRRRRSGLPMTLPPGSRPGPLHGQPLWPPSRWPLPVPARDGVSGWAPSGRSAFGKASPRIRLRNPLHLSLFRQLLPP